MKFNNRIITIGYMENGEFVPVDEMMSEKHFATTNDAINARNQSNEKPPSKMSASDKAKLYAYLKLPIEESENKLNDPLTLEVKEILANKNIDIDDVSKVFDNTMDYVENLKKMGVLPTHERIKEDGSIEYKYYETEDMILLKEKLKNKYDEVSNFRYEFVKVKKDGKWGFVDIMGQEIVKPIYDRVEDFDDIGEDGFATVYVDCQCDRHNNIIEHAKWLIIDTKGKEYDLDFSEGLATVKTESGIGVVNTKGEVVVPFEYYYIGDFENGKAEVITNAGEKFYIDTKGKK